MRSPQRSTPLAAPKTRKHIMNPLIRRSWPRPISTLAAIAVSAVLLLAGCKPIGTVSPPLGTVNPPLQSPDPIQVFPVSVGARWAYQYTEHYSRFYWGAAWWQQWSRGTITFTVEDMIKEGSRQRWIIREQDSLMVSDTSSWYSDITIRPDTIITRLQIFHV